ncbi:hypothetical protein HKX48_005637 [Thoreauomyces humboldtii]|nr:hypothetical protein HKX48_005637 [Thoreauomyces humboldtii]
MDHKNILSQCQQIAAGNGLKSTDIIASSLDARQQTGLLVTAFLGVYLGSKVLLIPDHFMATPGAWVMAITRNKATAAFVDNVALMDVISGFPLAANKKTPADLSTLQILLVVSTLHHPDFLDDVDKHLAVYGLPSTAHASPLLSLAEFGGCVVTMHERPGCTARVDLWLDPVGLQGGHVKIVGNSFSSANGSASQEPLHVTDVGCILPEISVAVVDPDSGALQPPGILGEIWVSGNKCLPRSFKGLAVISERVFNNHPLLYVKEPARKSEISDVDVGKFRIEVIDSVKFIRTNLLGFIVDGNAVPGVTTPRVFIAGLARDRLRQRKLPKKETPSSFLQRSDLFASYFASDLVETVCSNVHGVECCAIFTIQLEGEDLTVVLCETPRGFSDGGNIAARIVDVLKAKHGLRVYTVGVCPFEALPRALPRTTSGTQIQTTFHGYFAGIVAVPPFGPGGTKPVLPPRNNSTPAAVVHVDVNKRKIETIDVETCRVAFLGGEIRFSHLYMNVDADVVGPLAGSEDSPKADPVEPRHSRIGQVVGGMSQPPLKDDITGIDLDTFPSISHLFVYRALHNGNDVVFLPHDHKGREVVPIKYGKAAQKIRSLATYLVSNKRAPLPLHPHEFVILMYPCTLEFLFAVHACLYAGIVCIPMTPIDSARLEEDVPALLNAVDRWNVKAILCNGAVEETLKSKAVLAVARALRSTITAPVGVGGGVLAGSRKMSSSSSGVPVRAPFPPTVNTTGKIPKVGQPMAEDDPVFYHANMQASANDSKVVTPALVLAHYDNDTQAVYSTYTHASLLAQLRIQTIHANLTRSVGAISDSPAPFLATVDTHAGLGFLYAACLGIFVNRPTLYLPSDDHPVPALPQVWFEILYKHKIKDVVASYAQLEYAMQVLKNQEYRSFSMHFLRNMALPLQGRPRIEVFRQLHQNFQANRLDDAAIATGFSPAINSLVSSRAYARGDLATLALDRKALQRGVVKVQATHWGETGRERSVDPQNLLLQDSGKIVNNTVVAIVQTDQFGRDPTLCSPNRLGEIWVCSPGNAHNAPSVSVSGLDESLRFAPSGAYGFLHPVPTTSLEDLELQPGRQLSTDPWDALVLAGKPYEMLLFVVGKKCSLLEIAGRWLWKPDIESAVEGRAGINMCVAHNSGDGRITLFVESSADAPDVVHSTPPLISSTSASIMPVSVTPARGEISNTLALVPVIVHKVIEAHGILIAEVVVVRPGSLPRTRCGGGKFRRRTVDTWRNGKLPVVTAFSVRNTPSAGPAAPQQVRGRNVDDTDDDLGVLIHDPSINNESLMN